MPWESCSLSSVFGFLFLKLNLCCLKKISAANIIECNRTDATWCTPNKPRCVGSVKVLVSESFLVLFQLRGVQRYSWKGTPETILFGDNERTAGAAANWGVYVFNSYF